MSFLHALIGRFARRCDKMNETRRKEIEIRKEFKQGRKQ